MARLRTLLVPLVFVGAGVALSACGSGGAVSDARSACVQVKAALALEKQAQSAGLASSAGQALAGRAMSTLLAASGAAAQATSSDGSWNVLQTTIQEAERVPISNLTPALTRICQVADSSTPYL